jgi:hypothetical protein
VSQDTGVVKKFLSIDSGLGDVPQAHDEEFERTPFVGREQLSEDTHDRSIGLVCRNAASADDKNGNGGQLCSTVR